MKLESISISGFRSVAYVEGLHVGAPTLLTGHNDAGKTALLDAIHFLLGGRALRDSDRTFIASEARADAGANPENEPVQDADVHGDQDAEVVTGGLSEGAMDVAVEATTEPVAQGADRVNVTWVQGRFLLREDEATTLNVESGLELRRISREGGAATYEYSCQVPDDERLQDFHALTIPLLKELIADLKLTADGNNKDALLRCLEAEAKKRPQIQQWVPAPKKIVQALPQVLRFAPTGAADAESAIKAALETAYATHIARDDMQGRLSSLESALQDMLTDDAADIKAHIMERFPDIGQVDVVPDVSFTGGLRNTQVSVTAREGENVRLGDSGAGRARRVALAVWEYTKGLLAGADGVDVVMLYDEPDTHLDYNHQRELMKLLRAQCGLKNVRMVVATHSMNLIDGVDIADVVHVRQKEHRTVLERLHDDSAVGKHLGSVAATLGLRNTVLLHERLFVGVEGVSEQNALPLLFKVATQRHLQSCGIALWACNNNEGALDFIDFLKKHDRKVSFLVDNDSRVSAKHIFSNDKLSKRGISPDEHALYLGDPNEFEDTFADQQWADVGNARWPRDAGGTWRPQDIAALRDERKFSDALLQLFKVGSSTGPQRKQELTTEMALHLRGPEEVPDQLRALFATLIERAE